MKKIILAACSVLLMASCKTLDRSIMPEPGAAKEVKIGKIESFTLDNGMKVFVVENHKLSKVSYSLQLNYDPVQEGPLAGLGSITGELLGTGTTTKDKDQIDKEVDFIGASFGTGANGIFASSLTKHQDELLSIMSDVVLNAKFTQSELDRIKTQTISGLASSKDDPDAIAANVSNVLNYGTDHPYGEVMTEASVENVNLAICNRYFQTYFRPNVAYMAIVGDITLEEARAKVTEHFGAWQKGTVPTAEYDTPQAPAKSQVAVINKPGAVQSVVNVTYPIQMQAGDSDALAAKVMTNILGGGSSARLFKNLREDKAYTYGAYSSISSDMLVGEFSANAKVRNDVTDGAIDEFLFELNKIRSEKVSQKELDGVKNNMAGKFAIALEQPATVARFAINIDKYNLPADHYTNYLQRLSAISVDDVYNAAQKYIQPNNANIIVVGSQKEVADRVERFGNVNFYDNNGNPAENLRPAPKGMNAMKVIEKYIAARGGRKLMEKVSALSTTYKVTITGAPMEIVGQLDQQAPNLFTFAMTAAGGTMNIQTQTYDGKTAKLSGMQGEQVLEGEELEELTYQFYLNPELSYEKLGYKVNLLGMTKIDGQLAYKLDVTNPLGSVESHYYNTDSGLLLRTEMVEETPMGSILAVTDLSNYKAVDGILYPHMIKQAAGPQNVTMEITKLMVTAAGGDYTIVAGDNLWKIARKQYNDGKMWSKIYKANKSKIKNPDLIFVGDVLDMP